MLPQLLGAILFYLTAFAFVFGLGALPLLPFERQIAVPERTALACAIGLAIAPLLLCVLAVCHVAFVFAPMAIAVSIVMAVRWFRARGASPADEHGDLRWYVLLPAVVFAIATFTSAGRVTTTSQGISIFGDYETFDLTYYASIAAELAHTTTIPPLSPFYAGSRIIYSYFPLIFLAGGLGTRWLGVVPLWRAAIGSAKMREWTPLAWIVIVGIALSFAVTVAPFPNSIQTYMYEVPRDLAP